MKTPASKRRQALAKLARDTKLSRRLKAINGQVVELQPKSKMRNRKTVYRGDTYDSLLEAEYAAYLDLLVVSGEVTSWERQRPVILLDGPKARDRETLIVDFLVHYADARGSRYEDAKGRILPVFLHKCKLWKRRVAHELWVVQKPKGSKAWVYRQMATGIVPAWVKDYA